MPGVHQARLFPASIWCPLGGGGTRESGRRTMRKRTVARSIGQVIATLCDGGGQLDRRRASIMQILKRSGERARFLGRFSGMHRALDGWMLARAPTSPAQALHGSGPRHNIPPYFCMTCSFEKLGLFVDQN